MEVTEDDTDIYNTEQHIWVTGFITESIYHDAKMAKTSAERSREYRARKKTNISNQSPISVGSSASVLKKNNVCIVNQESSQQSMTDDKDITCENNHLILYTYLMHRKSPDNKQIGNDHQSTVVQEDVQEQTIDQKNVSILKKQSKTAKTSAERSREYRARKKALKNAVIK